MSAKREPRLAEGLQRIDNREPSPGSVAGVGARVPNKSCPELQTDLLPKRAARLGWWMRPGPTLIQPLSC
jgi:hypothetical protein